MTERQYVFKADRVEKVTDGDSYWLHLDVGFRQSQLTEIRLLGFDCPETRKGSAFERAEGKRATALAASFLQADYPSSTLWVRTEPDPDDFGRWLGEVWREEGDGTSERLGETLAEAGLATVWPTRWHTTYDPENPR